MTKLRLTLAPPHRERGQALVLIAISFVAIAAFIGLAIDLGILIVQQAHLRRAVDAASLAAATQIREGAQIDKVGEFAIQFIDMNGLDRTTVQVKTCYLSNPSSPFHDAALCTNPPRKLIRVTAQMPLRFSFLPIIGLRETVLTADATSEAASVDLVLVIGTNETMGESTPGYGAAFDPNAVGGCNGNAGPQAAKNPNNGVSPQKCRPLWDAKSAAKIVLDRLYDDADRVAIVTYDVGARVSTITDTLSGTPVTGFHVIRNGDVNAVDGVSDSTGAYAAIDNITLFNAAPFPTGKGIGEFSPVNTFCTEDDPTDPDCGGMAGRSPIGVSANSLCAGCGIRRAAELLKAAGRPESVWIIVFLSDGFATMSDMPTTYSGDPALPGADSNGFCSGGFGASGPVPTWGLWNAPTCRNGGFGDGLGMVSYNLVLPNGTIVPWSAPKMSIENPYLRMCGPYHASQTACPPGALYVGSIGVTTTVPSTRTIVAEGVLTTTNTYTYPVNVAGQRALYYSAVDYAKDMIDFAALTVRCVPPAGQTNCTSPISLPLYNEAETHGSFGRLVGANVSIYAIGIGPRIVAEPEYSGARLLRYMAAVGDDGDRVTDPCLDAPGVPKPFASTSSCGNFYYARNPQTDLVPVFEDIAKKIFTRITR
jgi:Flp pilus assembly protein TadG